MEAKIKSKTKTEKETEEGAIESFSIVFEGITGETFTLRTEKEQFFDKYPQGGYVNIEIKSLQKKLVEE